MSEPLRMPAHDPRDPVFRAPGGAVPANTLVTLSLTVPREYAVEEALLCAECEARGRTLYLPMGRSPAPGERERFSAALPAGEPGLVFYWFRLRRAGGLPYFYGKMRPTPAAPAVTGGIYNAEPFPRWQITVYGEEQAPGPDWYGGGVTYQIFPDRFRRGRPFAPVNFPAPRRMHEDWNGIPDHRPGPDGEIHNDDFFGGDLPGVMEKLPYLESLGVSAIYLNPIFEAASNHRYDVGDYERIDPMLGTETDFAALCAAAGKHGIRVILDGVFSHTGSDSRYFNARGHYGGVGAAQSRNSPYYPWYRFDRWPEKYDCWWGVKTLPAVNELNPGFLEYILTGPDSILRRWLRAGAAGWRLDVADELPPEFIRLARRVVREEKPDALLIGEVWEDASHKVSYGQRRAYLLGRELDGVMNYPLREAVLAFLGGGDAVEFRADMEEILGHYPPRARRASMNLLGSHDTPRILTLLGCPDPPTERDARAVYRLTGAERARGKALLRLAAAILYAWPGSPTVYYGDEAGMEGFEDPFNRACYPWGREDGEVLALYRLLGAVRRREAALDGGELRFLHARGAVLAFVRELPGESLLICVNRGDTAAEFTADWPFARARELLSDETTAAKSGALRLTLPPLSAGLYKGEPDGR